MLDQRAVLGSKGTTVVAGCCRFVGACCCRGKPVYHTNVMMAIGTDVAVVCGESVSDDKERQHLLVRTAGSGLCVLEDCV